MLGTCREIHGFQFQMIWDEFLDFGGKVSKSGVKFKSQPEEISSQV